MMQLCRRIIIEDASRGLKGEEFQLQEKMFR